MKHSLRRKPAPDEGRRPFGTNSLRDAGAWRSTLLAVCWWDLDSTAGDIFDIAWKTNRRNYRLLQLHVQEPRRHTGTLVFLAACRRVGSGPCGSHRADCLAPSLADSSLEWPAIHLRAEAAGVYPSLNSNGFAIQSEHPSGRSAVW
jgi:hypothetical protein